MVSPDLRSGPGSLSLTSAGTSTGGVSSGKSNAPADQIVVGDVVRRLENLDSFVACFAGGSGCAAQRLCGLKPVLSGALEAFLAHLDRVTLAELVPDIAAFVRNLEQGARAA